MNAFEDAYKAATDPIPDPVEPDDNGPKGSSVGGAEIDASRVEGLRPRQSGSVPEAIARHYGTN